MKSYSQYEQDILLHQKYFADMTAPGFFIEVGADDGITFSNTCLYERELGWDGVCIEPKESAFPKLAANRSCKCIRAAVGKYETETVEFLEIEGWGRQLSGIVSCYDPQHAQRIERETVGNPKTTSKKLIQVPVVSLDSLILQSGRDSIDLISIDTEGSELQVLESISDASAMKVKVLMIENNYKADYPALSPVLREHFVLDGKIKLDEIYINKRWNRAA